jgi:hypothetical protein
VLGLGLLVAGVAAYLHGPARGRTVSEVKRDIHRLALRESDVSGRDDGGMIGPWWVAASSLDPATGRLVDFRLSSGVMELAARTAAVVIDAEQDTVGFDLTDVVFTRVPDAEANGPDHHLLRLEHHVLGPVPYGADIVPDADLGAPTLDEAASPSSERITLGGE